ncbi:MAG: XRE family transcriptional regulator [Desulfovibrio sp.]|jgi:hypothetical protein|nr:XRE family transcriptional regulator [Desulfovibrio sp.]
MFGTERYELRLFDDPLLTFEFVGSGTSGIGTKIVAMHSANRKLYPIELALSDKEFPDGELMKWLDNRIIPKYRAFVGKILKTFGLKANDVKGIMDACMGLSLNDSYWVVPSGFAGRFSEYNLYENRFSKILALVAYTGVGVGNVGVATSPELTSGGALPKAWRLIEGEGIFLYKGGTIGSANSGMEPYSEFYAAQIAERMDINHVHYDLESWKKILASKCKLFTDINTSFIPMWKLLDKDHWNIKSILSYCKGLGEEFENSVRDMFVFDAVVYNIDRHLGNFGVLRDNATGEIVAPAPVFDNGASLFHQAMKSDFRNLDGYVSELFPAFKAVTFESMAEDVLTQRQVAKLRRLIGFEFRPHRRYNIPKWRLKAIERYVQKRVPVLIGLAKSAAQREHVDHIQDADEGAEPPGP